MPKKVLVNWISSDGKMLINPLLLKLKNYPSNEYDITFFCNKRAYQQIIKSGLLPNAVNLELPYSKEITGKFNFMFEMLKRNLISFLILKKGQRLNDYDVIYSVSSVLDLILLPFLIKIINKKIKWVTVFDNVVPFSDPGNKIVRFLGWLFFRISLFLIKRADIIFVSTHQLMEFLVEMKFDPNRLVQSGLACDNEAIKRSIKIKKYEFDAVYLGRINETKGIYDLLKVLLLVKVKYKNFTLAIAGSGDKISEQAFKEKLAELGLEKNVKILGWLPEKDKFNILRSCKSFWFLSLSQCESFGVALLEAVCSGRMAFTYNLRAFVDIYKHGEISITNIGDTKTVARKILHFFEVGEWENKKGKMLLDRYSWKSVAEIEIKNIAKLF